MQVLPGHQCVSIFHLYHSFLHSPSVKGQEFKQAMLMGGFFSEILVGETKRVGIQCFVEV